MALSIKPDVKERVVRSRIPLGTPTLKMPLPKIQGYFCRWFNDEMGRVQQALSAGYEFVLPEESPEIGSDTNSDLGTRISRIVGVSDSGPEPLRAYLMKLRQDLRDEDDSRKQAELDKVDAAIRSGSIGPGDSKRYVKDISYQDR